LNENLVPAGHCLYDESQAHLPANHRFANLVNLSYVTARISHRPQTLHGYVMTTARKDSAVHVSLSSYLIVKQQVYSSKWPDYPGNALAPGTETPSPRLFSPGGFSARGTRENRSALAAQGSVGDRCPTYRSSPVSLSTAYSKNSSCGELT